MEEEVKNTDILLKIDDNLHAWLYFRGCPEICVHIRKWNSVTVIIEHAQKDSEGNWTEEPDGPELYTTDSSLYDMVLSGVADGLIGEGYAGAAAIFIDELPKSSQDFVINELHLGDYVRRKEFYQKMKRINDD